MKSRLLAVLLLAGASAFAGPRVFVGVGLGYPAPPPVAAYVPAAPGPGYTWVAGYYYPVGPRWVWRPGYWARAPYAHAYWVAPRYRAGRYSSGYWRR